MTFLGTPPGSDSASDPQPRRAGRTARVLLPAGVAAVAAVGVGLVPALAASGSPSLPHLTAQQLIAKVLAGHQQAVSGTVQTTADIGVPSQILGALPTSGATGAKSGAPGGVNPQALAASLLSGTHTFDVAADGPQKERITAPDLSGGPYEFVRNGSSAWAWQGSTKTATHITGLRTADKAGKAPGAATPQTPQSAAQEILKQAGPTTNVSVEGATRVAGHNAYVLLVSPKGSGSTIGDVRIAVDSTYFVPLQVQVQPSDGSSDILNVRFMTVSFSAPAASTFDFTAPSGAKIVEQSAQQAKGGAAPHKNQGRPQGKVIGQGWTSVYEITPSGAGKSGGLGELKSFGKSVPGGTLLSTRVLNVLVTDKGTIYAGAVTPQVLENAAKAA